MPPRKLISMSDNLVESFNKLSRNPKAPSGMIANEWHFDIRYVPLEPCPSHVVAMINPGSRYFHLERVPLGVGQDDGAISFFPESSKDAAPVVARALMFAFVNNMGNNRFMGRNAPPPYGPWNFTTEDRELAAAVGDELKRIGVRAPELCNVGVAKPDVIKIMQQHFNEIYKGLIASAGYTDIAAAALDTPDAIIFSNFQIANPPEIDSESQPKELQYVLQLTNSRPGTAGEVDAKAIGTKTMKEMARLEETLKTKPEAIVRREADNGSADASLDYGLRLLIGLQCTRDRTLAREYLVKAILAPNASDTIKTTAHGILIRWCLDAATDCIRSRYMLMASHHADQAALFSRRAAPKGIAPASVLVFMQNNFERFAERMPQLWLLFKNAMRAHDEREKQMQDGIEKMQEKRLEQPLRYRCAAVGCGIQADTGKMLQRCKYLSRFVCAAEFISNKMDRRRTV